MYKYLVRRTGTLAHSEGGRKGGRGEGGREEGDDLSTLLLLTVCVPLCEYIFL